MEYSTLSSNGGPSHGAGGPRFGALKDLEADAYSQWNEWQTRAWGVGDNLILDPTSQDEDGITFESFYAWSATSNSSGTLTLNVQNLTPGIPAYVNGFIDFNSDGDFTDAGEKIIDGVAFENGVRNFTFIIPANSYVGKTYARLRISSEQFLTSLGQASDGEVEDYQIILGGSRGAMRAIEEQIIGHLLPGGELRHGDLAIYDGIDPFRAWFILEPYFSSYAVRALLAAPSLTAVSKFDVAERYLELWTERPWGLDANQQIGSLRPRYASPLLTPDGWITEIPGPNDGILGANGQTYFSRDLPIDAEDSSLSAVLAVAADFAAAIVEELDPVAAAERSAVLHNLRVRLEQMASTLRGMIEKNGLTFGFLHKAEDVQQTMDNAEVYEALKRYAWLQRTFFGDAANAAIYDEAAERVAAGLEYETFRLNESDPANSYYIQNAVGAFFSAPPNPEVCFYPQAMAQIWPTILDVVPADSARARQLLNYVTEARAAAGIPWFEQTSAASVAWAAVSSGGEQNLENAREAFAKIADWSLQNSNSTPSVQDWKSVDSNLASVTISDHAFLLQTLLPAANDDVVTTGFQVPVEIDVRANDFVLFTDPADLTVQLVEAPADGTVQLSGQNFLYTPAANFRGDDSFTYRVTASDGGTREATVTVQVDSIATLHVSEFTATPTGFVVEFSRPVVRDAIDLYGSSQLSHRDVVLTGANSGLIAGSAVLSNDRMRLTFVTTTGRLQPDDYTLTLRSALDGFRDDAAELLDGDANRLAGANYVRSFSVSPQAAGTVTLSLPNVVRGPGQGVHLPTLFQWGLPISFSDGGGITAADFQLRYDPQLLTVFGVRPVDGLPSGSTVFIDWNVPGIVGVRFRSPTPLPAGTTHFIDLLTAVPESAPYGAKQVLDLTSIFLNDDAIPSLDDDAMQVVAYFGDSTANGTYSALDASLAAQLGVGIITGLEKFPLLDPRLLADISGNGSVSAVDVSLLLQKSVAIDVPQIPPLPAQAISLVQGGPDPKLSIPTDLVVTAGNEFSIPVHVDSIVDLTGNGLQSAELAIYFNAASVQVSSVSLGRLVENRGWSIAARIDPLAGRVFVSLAGIRPLEGKFVGDLVRLQATAAQDAHAGAVRINLAANARDPMFVTQLNEGFLTLIPAPTDAANDPGVDGRVTILARSPSVPVIQWLAPQQVLLSGFPASERIIVGRLSSGELRVRLLRNHVGDFPADTVILLKAQAEQIVIGPGVVRKEQSQPTAHEIALWELWAEDQIATDRRRRTTLPKTTA